MNDIEQSNRQIHIIANPLSITTKQRKSQRQRISPSPEPEPNLIDQTKMTNPQKLNNVNEDNNNNNNNNNNTMNSSSLSNKKPLSTSDLDSFEQKRQAALAKVEAKLEKAQRLHQSAQQSVEQNISEFLRVTTIPGIIQDSQTTNTAYEKRIRTLQETKKELEKKIANYQADINRIQSGDIPYQYSSSSKEFLNNIKNKVSRGNSSKPPSINDISTSNEQSINESDIQLNLPKVSSNHNIGTINNNPNVLSISHNSNTLDIIRSSPSNSISNEIGNSQFYIDSNFEHIYDKKYERVSPADLSASHDLDKSPSSKRRLTEDSNVEFNDRISDHSSDDRFVSYNTSKRNTMSSNEYHQLVIKIDLMQKAVDRYDTKMLEMQKQMDLLTSINETQREQNERLNNEITDLTDLHQNEMLQMKNDLRKLEEKLLYNFNDYWTEMVEKLDKLDTRTTKVEQTQTHSLETEENTHRIITKFVNILLTVFAIILLLLSTIKNLVQSRVHAIILLILVFTWISFHYLPENDFQKNFTNIFKRTSKNFTE